MADCVPLQNQAASQKLLQKMSHSNLDGRHSKGRKYRGKGKQEEPVVFTLDEWEKRKAKQEEPVILTLDEWEKRKAGAKTQMRNDLLETSCDEDLARQLQAQLDLEDYHVSVFATLSYAVANAVIFVTLQFLIKLLSCSGTKNAWHRSREH